MVFLQSFETGPFGMRFSLIGDLEEAALLVDGIVRLPDCSLGAVWMHGNLEARLGQHFPPDAVLVASPEEALIAPQTDAVIVAESDPDRSMQACRQACQADRHIVAVPAHGISTAWSYELHLLLDESRCGILVLSGRQYLSPAVAVHLTSTDDFELGLPPPFEDVYDDATILYAVDQVAALGFGVSQVTAMEVGSRKNKPAGRQIVLTALAQDASGVPGDSMPSITLNASASADPFRLRCRSVPEQPGPLLTIPTHTDQISGDNTEALCANVVRTLEDRHACQSAMEQFSHTLQIGEAICSSLRRRRTVDVYHEGVTERSVFKSQMTAIGCGILMWLMLGLVGYLVTAQLFTPPPIVLHVMRILWFLPAVLFLLAQLLLPIARGRNTDDLLST